MSQQNDIENVWEQLVGDAFTPAEPLPPPPEFAGAIDEEMQARPSARLPLHVVPMSGPDSDAVPIEVVERPGSDKPAPRARKVDVVRRPQTEADAMAAPQAEVTADPVVEVDVRRRKRRLAPTMRTSAVPVDDELDVALFELAQTGPHATVSADEIVELDVGDLDIEEVDADGRAVLEVDLVESEEDDSTVAGVIDLAEPSAAPRGPGDARASTRSAAIANAMRGATVRVPLVPERKVKTAMVSMAGVPRGKAATVKTGAVALAHAVPETMPVQMAAIDPVPMAVVPAAMPVAQPTPTPLPGRVPLASSSSSSSMMMRRVAVGERVVAPRRGPFTWVVGAVVIAVAGIGVAALTAGGGSKGPKPAPVVASAQVPAPAEMAAPAIEPPAVSPADSATPARTVAPAPEAVPSDTSARAPAPSVAPPQQAETEEPHREAGLAYVAAVERYEADHSNEAVEAMVSAACAMDDGPRARSAFRKLRGGDQRSRVMIACRDRGIDLWARVDGPTAGELLVVAQRQLAEGDLVRALETARESNHVARNNGALLVMGIVQCRLGNAEEAAELERHLPPRMRTDLETACAGS